MFHDYPIIPGRGLNTDAAVMYRREYLTRNGKYLPHTFNSAIDLSQIRNNIESYIGSVEIPVGLAGPLSYNSDKSKEFVYAPIATLEGALIASINRGAKVICQSGGFNAEVLHQRMIRSPMFIFKSLKECVTFKEWVEKNYQNIIEISEQYSNHAKVIDITTNIINRSVHMKFSYSTEDASGQNMTTTCTWHALLWIKDKFSKDCDITPVNYVIEGNSSSDKKISSYTVSTGRGIHVVAECELSDEAIRKTLRVEPSDIIKCLNISKSINTLDGMRGFNVNVVNVIAAIFASTGQDLASIHESGTAVLSMEKTETGIYCSLSLTNLVIGTIGGGTHLPKQREALQLMDCYGSGKVERFAKLIAGFALSLEISTIAAVVGGQFAKAHEKLGRNKPKNWIVKAEINKNFISDCLIDKQNELTEINFPDNNINGNGIITNLTNCINKKFTGISPIRLTYNNTKSDDVVLKCKPSDNDVIKGLHKMSAAIDPQLADLISANKENLEYCNCHFKEIIIYEFLNSKKYQFTPKLYGTKSDDSREVYMLFIELMNLKNMKIINSEYHSNIWAETDIKNVITAIDIFHKGSDTLRNSHIKHNKPWKSDKLYKRLTHILLNEYKDSEYFSIIKQVENNIEFLEEEHNKIIIDKTIVHNDLNSRNIAITKNNEVKIYDWELVTINFPQRDIVELLSFTLNPDFTRKSLNEIINHHYKLQEDRYEYYEYINAFKYSLKEYMVTRVMFYLTGNIMVDYGFAERVLKTSARMLQYISSYENTSEIKPTEILEYV